MNLTELLKEAAPDDRDVALRLDGAPTSFGALHRERAVVAGWLAARGIGPGDRVALMLPNVPQFAFFYYGILSVGAVVVPLNPMLRPREITYHLADSDARLLIAWAGDGGTAEHEHAATDTVHVGPGDLAAQLDDPTSDPVIVDRDPGDTAVLLYTSGTTGRPKGAQLTHANLTRNAQVTREVFGFGREDVVFGGLPLFHSFGQTCALNAALSAGASVALLPRFDAGMALEIIDRDGVTAFLGVPTMYGAILHHERRAAFDVSTLRVGVAGGAPLPVELLRRFEATFGCPILEGYGLSETSPVAAFNRRDRERKPGSIGLPLDGVEMKVVDAERRDLGPDEPGEIAIRGDNVMRGYWRNPEATAEAIDADGWFYSGDIARVDRDGYYFIVDRKKDLILRGGYNVYPREVEEVLYEHPAVREAAVVGVPDDTWGEEVGAAVALQAGVEVDVAELRAFVRERVAGYKYPRLVWLVDDLPKGPTGKILRRAIEPPVDVAKGA